MTVKLIYHNSESASGGVSPFDEVIARIVRGKDIQIACPYLSVSYLKRILQVCKSWRILSDVEEWLASHTLTARKEIQDFVTEHLESIHHYKDLHAKLIIADNAALLGSANFTEKGITGRTELSVLFEGEEQTEELHQWFDILWSQTTPVNVSEMKAYIHSLPDIRLEKSHCGLTSKAPKVKARLRSLNRDQGHMVYESSQQAHQRLVERVRIFPNREWINGYFELVKELIEFTGLANDDPRLVLSIPQDKILPVTINRRYVLATSRRRRAAIGLIFGSDFSRIPELEARAAHTGRFNPFSGETEEDTPYFIWLKGTPNSLFDDEATDELKEEWREAVLFEVRHGRYSPFRKFHEPTVYEAAMNSEYRRRVLDEAFSDSPAV